MRAWTVFCAREEQLNQGKWQSSNSYESDLMSAEASVGASVRLRVFCPTASTAWDGTHPCSSPRAGRPVATRGASPPASPGRRCGARTPSRVLRARPAQDLDGPDGYDTSVFVWDKSTAYSAETRAAQPGGKAGDRPAAQGWPSGAGPARE